MTSWIWIFAVVISTIEAVKTKRQQLSRDQLPIATAEHIDAFTSFLRKCLQREAVFHRDLLITSHVIPAPPNYQLTQFDGNEYPDVPYPTELSDYFNRHINDIFSSADKFDLALNKLLGKRVIPLFYQQAEEVWRQNATESSDVTSSTSTVNPEVTSRQSRRGKSYEILCSVDMHSQSSYCRTSFPSTPKHTTLRQKLEKSETEDLTDQTTDASVVEEITTEYIKYLTEMSTVSGEKTSENGPESSSKLTPLDDEYITFLLSGSVSSTAQITEESETVRINRENSQRSLFLPSEGHPNIPSEEPVEFDSMNFSPVTGRLLTVENVQLLDENVELTPEIKYYVISTSHSNLNKALEGEVENIQTESTNTEMDSTTRISSTVGDKRRKRLDHTEPDITISKMYTTETILNREAKMKWRTEQMDSGTSESEMFYSTETVPIGEADMRQPKQVHPSDDAPRMFLIRGTPGLDFPEYEDIPNTNFTCQNKTHIPGFYADQETNCQAFHVCWPGRRESFLCPIGTIFDQFMLACDYWYNSNCTIAHAFHNVNEAFKEVDPETGTTGPMVDTLINAPNVKPEIISSIKNIAELYEADVHFSETLANHDISKIWRFLPIQAKIFVEPQPELEQFLRSQNLTKTVGKRELESNLDPIPANIEDLKRMIEDRIMRTLKKLSSSGDKKL